MLIIGKQDRDEPLERVCEREGLAMDRLPSHVAIVMDGNGRWAKKRHMPRSFGHKEGAEALRRTIQACVRWNIHYLTVYVFSTENWKRPEEEVSFLMDLLRRLIIKEIPKLNQEGVRVRYLGNTQALNVDIQQAMREAEEQTQDNQVLQLNLMVNYGARADILSAVEGVRAYLSQHPQETLSDEMFEQFLCLKESPDPDLLIRTGGDCRVSNYLLWQIAYSELFFLETLWPDFSEKDLVEVLKLFQKRDRRFGGLSHGR